MLNDNVVTIIEKFWVCANFRFGLNLYTISLSLIVKIPGFFNRTGINVVMPLTITDERILIF